MILVCAVGTLAEVYDGKPGDQKRQMAAFLTLYGPAAEWSAPAVGGDTLTQRFGTHWRHALVHATRIRYGDEYRSGREGTGRFLAVEVHPLSGR